MDLLVGRISLKNPGLVWKMKQNHGSFVIFLVDEESLGTIGRLEIVTRVRVKWF